MNRLEYSKINTLSYNGVSNVDNVFDFVKDYLNLKKDDRDDYYFIKDNKKYVLLSAYGFKLSNRQNYYYKTSDFDRKEYENETASLKDYELVVLLLQNGENKPFFKTMEMSSL